MAKGHSSGRRREHDKPYIRVWESINAGQYENGKKNGIGKFTYGNGREYEGEWVNGQQHGEGTLRQNGEVIFKGYWTSGTPLRTSKAV